MCGKRVGEVRVVSMKILSWNVKGLGGLEKKRDVCLLVGEKLPLVLCIQETKLQTFDDFVSASVWGSSPHSYSFRPSMGASGVFLTVWDSSEVEV